MKQRKKWIIGTLVIVFLVIFFAGKRLLEQKQEDKRWSLIYIPKTVDGTNDFWTSLISGVRIAAKEYDADIEVLAPDQEQDVEEQNQILKYSIESKPDAILISPSSFTASNELLEEAKRKNIPVIFVDSYTEKEVQSLTVSTDNLEAGKKLGEYAVELLDKDSQIAIVGHVKGVSTATEREMGFREGLGELEKNIVDVVYCNSQYDISYTLTMELITKYPELEMIAGLNEYSSVGAARAVRDAGVKDRIKVVGIDSSKEAIQLMEQGVFRGLVIQKAFKMGYTSVKETIRLLKGEKVEKNIDSGCELVTLENMYNSEIEKLIFPFESMGPMGS